MGFNCKFSIMNESIRESNAHYTRVDHVVVESSSQEVMAGLLRHSTRKLYSSVRQRSVTISQLPCNS